MQSTLNKPLLSWQTKHISHNYCETKDTYYHIYVGIPWNENTIQITSLGYLHMTKVTNMYVVGGMFVLEITLHRLHLSNIL